MGNLCSHDSEKIEHLENKIDEQNENINRLYAEYKLLKRENKYLNNRITSMNSYYGYPNVE